MTRIDFTGIAYLVAIALAGVVGFVIYRQAGDFKASLGDLFTKLGDAAGAAARATLDAVNPASQNNLAYAGANAITQAATGDEHATVGTKLAEWFDPKTRELAAQLKADRPMDLAQLDAALSAEDQFVGAWMRVNEFQNKLDAPTFDYSRAFPKPVNMK